MQKLIIFLLFFLIYSNSYAEDEYFLTLRNEKVNLRQGPSFDYPVKIFYKKKFLPVLVQDKSENFRKIRDHENNSGWIHISQLSKKKAAIVIDKNSYIYSKDTVYSKPLAIAEIGKLLLVKKCKNEWCEIKDKEVTGWIKNKYLWGKL
jgi:SH3-like domain-containing protein